jgi:cell wall-associated NlpC family hydrolase
MGNLADHDKELQQAPASALVVQISDLLPGDVLLFRPRERDALQQRVSAAIGSPYTHAAIYLSDAFLNFTRKLSRYSGILFIGFANEAML